MPAFGWLSSLQSGLLTPDVVVDDVPPLLEEVLPLLADELPLADRLRSALCAEVPCVAVEFLEAVVLSVLVEVCANAGAAPSIAAMARVLRNWERIIECLLSLRKGNVRAGKAARRARSSRTGHGTGCACMRCLFAAFSGSG